jgi:hypothetical protein
LCAGSGASCRLCSRALCKAAAGLGRGVQRPAGVLASCGGAGLFLCCDHVSLAVVIRALVQGLLKRNFRRRSLWLLKAPPPPPSPPPPPKPISSFTVYALIVTPYKTPFLGHPQLDIASEQLVASLLSSASADELRRLVEMNVRGNAGILLRVCYRFVSSFVTRACIAAASSCGPFHVRRRFHLSNQRR